MMPGSKGLNPHELAHRWMKDLGTRPDMSIKGILKFLTESRNECIKNKSRSRITQKLLDLFLSLRNIKIWMSLLYYAFLDL